jgi:hypothetical protein
MVALTKNNGLILNRSQFRVNSKVAPPPTPKFFPLNPSNNPVSGDSFKRFSKSATVCYFFDQQQKGATTASCSKGRDCEYLHEVSPS